MILVSNVALYDLLRWKNNVVADWAMLLTREECNKLDKHIKRMPKFADKTPRAIEIIFLFSDKLVTSAQTANEMCRALGYRDLADFKLKRNYADNAPMWRQFDKNALANLINNGIVTLPDVIDGTTIFMEYLQYKLTGKHLSSLNQLKQAIGLFDAEYVGYYNNVKDEADPSKTCLNAAAEYFNWKYNGIRRTEHSYKEYYEIAADYLEKDAIFVLDKFYVFRYVEDLDLSDATDYSRISAKQKKKLAKKLIDEYDPFSPYEFC